MPNSAPRPVGAVVLAAWLAALLLVIAVLGLAAQMDRTVAPAGAVFGYELPGVVFNRLTGARLAGAQLDCGVCAATSDLQGRFTLTFGPGDARRCRVTAVGFEPQFANGQSVPRLGVWLTPDPVWTVRQIIQWEEQRDFGRQYDLLHPDVRRSWTREEFCRVLDLTEDRRVLSAEHGSAVYLPKWDYYGDQYDDVAEVPTWITFEQHGQQRRVFWPVHLVKLDNLWHWFREPEE
jgi:hypothetical protein